MFGMASQGTGGFGTQQGIPGYGYGSPLEAFSQGIGSIPPYIAQQLQQTQPQFGISPFGTPGLGQQFGQGGFGQQFGQGGLGQQFGQGVFGQSPWGPSQSPIQVLPVVTPQGWFGVLVLAKVQPVPVGIGGGIGLQQLGLGGITGGLGGRLGGIGGGHLPLQAQQQIPQSYMPFGLAGVGGVPGQSLGYGSIH